MQAQPCPLSVFDNLLQSTLNLRLTALCLKYREFHLPLKEKIVSTVYMFDSNDRNRDRDCTTPYAYFKGLIFTICDPCNFI